MIDPHQSKIILGVFPVVKFSRRYYEESELQASSSFAKIDVKVS